MHIGRARNPRRLSYPQLEVGLRWHHTVPDPMIQSFSPTSFYWSSTHWLRGVSTRPGRQRILSSSTTRNSAISPSCLASVDLPEAPKPMITTRFIRISFSLGHSEWITSRPEVIPGAWLNKVFQTRSVNGLGVSLPTRLYAWLVTLEQHQSFG